MRTLLFLAFTCLAQTLFSQHFEISGKIMGPDGGPLESATIFAEKPGDSSLISYAISEKDGAFLLSGNTGSEKLYFNISYAGFKPYRQEIAVQRAISLGKIELEVLDQELDEILVLGTQAPIVIKKDTLEFNADSFTTRPDANLEELLKKIPGVEVETDGSITVNGKPIQRILVNGKEFFGDDPQIATKNLPKEIIEKIQVTETKTRSQEFTGKAGDSENQTINVTLKKDRDKGYFARATAGGGTDKRYELSGIGNYFKGKMRVSALASSNNINSSGFSFDEIFDMMGRNSRGNQSIRGLRGGGNGITKAETAGFNLVNEWDEKWEVNTDYFFGRNETETWSRTQRENILPDSRYYSNSENSGNVINDSHRASGRVEVEFDTLTRLSIRPRYNGNKGFSQSRGVMESLDENRDLINNTSTSDNEELQHISFNNSLDFTRRFGSRGAYLQVRLSHDHSNRRNDNFYYSQTKVFREGDGEENRIQDQYIDEDQKEDNLAVGVNQRSVLSDQLFLDLSYDFSTTRSTNTRNVFDGADGNYEELDPALSNGFEVRSKKNVPNAGINYEGETLRFSTHVGLLNTQLKTRNFFEEVSFNKDYNNLFLRANLKYEISRSKNIFLDYNTSTDVPSIRQLQPVTDRTNPLNIVTGNPDLDPTFRQHLRLHYRNFDFSTRSGFFGNASVSFTDDNVVPVTSTDEDLVRTTTYANVDGVINANLGGSYMRNLKKETRSLGFRLGLNGSFNNNVGFTNAVKYQAKNYRLSPWVSLNYAIEELLDINPGYWFSYNHSRYDIREAGNEEFANHTLSLEATFFWPEHVIFGNDISFNYFGNVSPGFDNTAFLWNISLGYQFLEDNATIKLKVYDMLNQNVDTRRVIGEDFIQDTSSLILRRYGMLSFTYKLSNFGGGDSSGPSGTRRRRRW